jgi:hypothetical protein
LTLFFSLFPASQGAAETTLPSALPVAFDYQRLLEGCLARDAESARLILERDRTALELERYAQENGLTFTLSSGDAVFTFSPGGLSVSAKPGIELALPGPGNPGLNLAAPVQSRQGNPVELGVDLSLTALVAGGRPELRRTGALERERAFVTAQRDLEFRRFAAEEAFCRRIKELLSHRDAMLEARRRLLEAAYELERRRAGAYSGVVLKTAELEYRGKERELREAERTLDSARRDFAELCGIPEARAPENIPDEPLLPASSFDPALLRETEQARWTYQQNNRIRRAQNQPITLETRTGYSWRQSGAAPLGSAPAGSSLNAGAGLSVGGISVSAGIAVPLARPSEPSLSFSVRWNPAGGFLSRLDRQIRALEAQRELQAIDGGERLYRDLVAEYDRKKADLEWQKETYAEEAELYRINVGELDIWLKRGVIRESDYANARTNYLLAVNRVQRARIDRRLYNLELRGRFIGAGK